MVYDKDTDLRRRISIAMDSVSDVKRKKIEVDNSADRGSVLHIVLDIFSGTAVGFIVWLIYKYIFGYNVNAMVICVAVGIFSGIYLALMKLFKNN